MKKYIQSASIAVLFTATASAATLATYDFDSNTTDASSTDPGVTASSISAGLQTSFFNGTSGGNVPGTSSNFTTGLGAGTGSITYESLSLEDWAWNSDWDITISYTDGGSNVGSYDYSISSGSNNLQSIDIADFTSSNTVTWTITTTNLTANTNVYRFDDLTLTGTVNPIPEPTSAALLGLGGIALISRRKR